MLSSILKTEISDIILQEGTIMEKDLFDDKIGILDIKARLNNDTNCDIEMQIVDRKNIEKRILYYWSKLYVQEIKRGIDYINLRKTIVVLFVDYELESLKKVKKCITKWNIREEEYVQVVLTNVLEFYIIELPKFKKYKEKMENENLNKWIKFIENPEVVDMGENEAIKKAKEVLAEISGDARERELAELREKYILDQKAIEDAGYDKGVKAGIEVGIREGREKGIKEGIKEEKKETAKRLLNSHVEIDVIIEATGLTKEEIEKLV